MSVLVRMNVLQSINLADKQNKTFGQQTQCWLNPIQPGCFLVSEPGLKALVSLYLQDH